MKEYLKKNIYLLVIFLIGILKTFDYFYKNYQHSKLTVKVVGKIYDYDISAGLDEYYEFKYFYKNKLYKESEPLENKLDKSLIGNCFEVKLDPCNPNNSKLYIQKKLDCDLYLRSVKSSN